MRSPNTNAKAKEGLVTFDDAFCHIIQRTSQATNDCSKLEGLSLVRRSHARYSDCGAVACDLVYLSPRFIAEIDRLVPREGIVRVAAGHGRIDSLEP